MDKREADERLIGSWHAYAYRYALFLTGNRERAQDLAQDALIRALIRRPPDLPDEAFGGWLRTVMMRLQIDHGRRIVREVAAFKRWFPLFGGGEISPEPEAESSLLEALSALSPRQRACVVLRYLDDLTEAEVAAVLGLRPGTVKAHLARARESLRAKLTLETDLEADLPFRVRNPWEAPGTSL